MELSEKRTRTASAAAWSGRPDRRYAVTARALPLIRTMTVGPGLTPGPPADGFDRVADFDTDR
jgi:hypothetical protein